MKKHSLFIGSHILPGYNGISALCDGKVISLEAVLYPDEDDGTGREPVDLILSIDDIVIHLIKKNEAFVYEFEGASSNHSISVKHTFSLSKKKESFTYHPDGLTFRIDHLPVHHTKTDPSKSLMHGLYGTYLFLIIMAVKAIRVLIGGMYGKEEMVTLIVYSSLCLTVFLAERMFRRHHLISLGFILSICSVELLYYGLNLTQFFHAVIHTYDYVSIFILYWTAAFRLLAFFLIAKGVYAAIEVSRLNRSIHRKLGVVETSSR